VLKIKWCYISKRVLDQAISLYRKTYPGGKLDEFRLTWTPYYLNYNPHPHSIDKLELAKTHAKTKDLTAEQREKLTQRMDRAGRAAGIVFRWGGKIGPNPSSRDAHRLIRWSSSTERRGPASAAAGEGNEMRDALIEGLFEAYHVLEQDISDRAVLRDVAVRAGFDAKEVSEYLDSGLDADVVDEEARKSKSMADAGVPLLVIQGTNRLDGVQDILDVMEAFVKVKENC
jgi:predicted DsbA family dithiol-disulfide isomerase